jgi:AcrR family transcriptional regulator
MAAAIEEINNFGIKFTMSDLVKRLSISKSTLYAHFRSKEELIGAIVDSALASLRRQMQDILNNNTLNVPEKLEALSMTHSPVDISIRFMIDLKRHFPAEWGKIEQHRNEKWASTEALVQQGIEAGCFRPMESMDLAVLRIIIDATEKELMDHSFFVNNTISFTESIHRIVDILLKGIMKNSSSE